MVKITTSDSKEFTIEKVIAEKSILLKNMMEDLDEDSSSIPLNNVSSAIFSKIIDYLQHHKDDMQVEEKKEDDAENSNKDKEIIIDEWDSQLMTSDKKTIIDITLAANFLDIKPLTKLGCKTIAKMIKNLSIEQVNEEWNTYEITGKTMEEIKELQKVE